MTSKLEEQHLAETTDVGGPGQVIAAELLPTAEVAQEPIGTIPRALPMRVDMNTLQWKEFIRRTFNPALQSFYDTINVATLLTYIGEQSFVPSTTVESSLNTNLIKRLSYGYRFDAIHIKITVLSLFQQQGLMAFAFPPVHAGYYQQLGLMSGTVGADATFEFNRYDILQFSPTFVFLGNNSEVIVSLPWPFREDYVTNLQLSMQRIFGTLMTTNLIQLGVVDGASTQITCRYCIAVEGFRTIGNTYSNVITNTLNIDALRPWR